MLEITQNEFEEKVLKSDKPVLVDFFATWCGPCKMLAPTIEKLAEEFSGTADVYKVDVDKNEDLARQYRIMSIPTIIVFMGGEVVKKAVGALDEDELISMIEANL